MKGHRQSLLIGVLALLAAAGIVLYSSISKARPGIDFPTEIIVAVSASTTYEQVSTIVDAAHGTLLGLAEDGMPSGIPNVTMYLVEVTWAKNERDTDSVRAAISAHSTILWAELNGLGSIQN